MKYKLGNRVIVTRNADWCDYKTKGLRGRIIQIGGDMVLLLEYDNPTEANSYFTQYEDNSSPVLSHKSHAKHYLDIDYIKLEDYRDYNKGDD